MHSWDEVDRYMITEFLQSLHEEQQASASVIRMISSLRGFHQFLRQERLSEHNPMQHIDSPRKFKNCQVHYLLTK
ncbi:site-specific integrase [Enterococcus faecalis]|nr:site-specific integrase [Enterococcus faecalis]